METIINNIVFEWDDEKNRTNIRKHNIDFNDAAKVFGDENRIERLDLFHSDDKDRWQVISMVDNILFVVYTEREDKTRLISARLANKKRKEDILCW